MSIISDFDKNLYIAKRKVKKPIYGDFTLSLPKKLPYKIEVINGIAYKIYPSKINIE